MQGLAASRLNPLMKLNFISIRPSRDTAENKTQQRSRPCLCNLSCVSHCLFYWFYRKMYWTDGNTINMANMDGSNSKILHQNQKEPVGKSLFYLH